MNEKVNKEIELFFLDLEDETLEKIKKTYERSLKDVQNKAKELQDELDKLIENVDPNDEIAISQIRSKVYQLGYQKNLEKQIANYMNIINDDDVKNIDDYLKEVYSNGFMCEQYRLMANGLNITMPINQKLLEKAVNTTFDDIPLSTRIYENVNKAKRNIISEISRGLSIGMSNQDMARNLKNSMGVSMRKAFQIAQNEGARVRQSAIYDNMVEAKKKGADIVKQWSATLDGKTRPVHAELDGQYAEIDEYFKYSGGKVFAPKQFGIASEDINCRCTLLTVPRWDITDKHWQIDNETKELVEVKNYADWVARYKIIVNGLSTGNSNYSDVPPHKTAKFVKKLDTINKTVVLNELISFEKKHVNEKIEHAYVVTKNGEVYHCYGVENGVFPDYDLGDKLEGASVTHNHPSYYTEYTFSQQDMDLFIKYKLDVLRGIDEKYTYEFTKDPLNIDEEPTNWMSEEQFEHSIMIKKAKENKIGYRRWENEKRAS